jgi:hypothetical protein
MPVPPGGQDKTLTRLPRFAKSMNVRPQSGKPQPRGGLMRL